MLLTESPKVKVTIETYPAAIQAKIHTLRDLIIATATETSEINTLEETLKWGEPSYLTPTGSTLRIGWKQSQPDHYALYCNCNTRLVDTFSVLYPNVFTFEKNRAIVFHVTDSVPVAELTHCIRLALTYHRIKHLPLLGA